MMKQRIVRKGVSGILILSLLTVLICADFDRLGLFEIVRAEEPLLSADGKYQYVVADEEQKQIAIVGILEGAIDASGRCAMPNTIDGYQVAYLDDGLFSPDGPDDFKYQLTSVVISEGVKEIPQYCFYHCENLFDVHFPSTLTAIRSNAFNTCTSLEALQFPISVVDFYSGAFWFTPWLFHQREVREDHLVIVNNVVIDALMCEGDVEIPDGVVEIGQTAFYGPEHMHVGTNITSSKVESVTMADSVKSVASFAFYGCENLKSIQFSDQVNYVGQQAFVGCIALQNVVLPKGIAKVHGTAFNGLSNLSVTIPKEVEVFSGINVVDLAKNVKFRVYENSMAQYYLAANEVAFEVIQSEEKEPGAEQPEDVKPTDDPPADSSTQAPAKNPVDDSKTDATTESLNTTNTQVLKKGDILSVKGYKYKVLSKNTVAFLGVKKKQKSVVIPATIRVAKQTYKVVAISKNAFKNDGKLKKITIGKQIKKIEKNAFCGCKKLQTIVFQTTKLKTVGAKSFRGVPKKAKVKVPQNYKAKYRKLISKGL